MWISTQKVINKIKQKIKKHTHHKKSGHIIHGVPILLKLCTYCTRYCNSPYNQSGWWRTVPTTYIEMNYTLHTCTDGLLYIRLSKPIQQYGQHAKCQWHCDLYRYLKSKPTQFWYTDVSMRNCKKILKCSVTANWLLTTDTMHPMCNKDITSTFKH
jgi:hypothetical protein